MGGILFRDGFDSGNTAKEESVINLSDQCIERITREETEAEEKLPDSLLQPTDSRKVHDDKWMKILKCMDDVHTNRNELTPQAIDELMGQVESNIGKLRSNVCSTDELLLCLKRHEKCMIKCKKLMDEFIDCVDKSRIEIVKQKIEEENKSIQENQNELAKDFLSVTEH